MPAFDLIDRIIAREGGAKLTNDPLDPGGVTKYGISQRANPDVDVPNLTYEGARKVYTNKYLVGTSISLLPDWAQEAVCDFGVHSGPQEAIRLFQRLLGVHVDGKIGPATLAAANSASNKQLILRTYERERCLYLVRQCQANPQKLRFLAGWIARVLSLPTPQ